jgi:multiple sugar transport system permease protein
MTGAGGSMGTAEPMGAPSRPVAAMPRGRPRRSPADMTRTAVLTTLYLAVLLVFLAPLAYSFLTAIKTESQMSQANSPVLPSDPRTFEFEGETYDVYYVPMPDGQTRELALVRKGRRDADFIDPANTGAGVITWEGSWRTLAQPWQTAPHFENFADVWNVIDFPRHLANTLLLAFVTTIGTVLSCTLVAYGFARFRFPGRAALFTLVLSTIFLPAAVTLIPTYAVFVKLGWVGSYLPLLVPAFFANAYDVFLLRQYLMTIPRDHDEAAMIDGAGPFRILRSVILPQAWPVIVAVAIFTFVYSWNDYFGPLIYLAGHEEMQPLQVALAHFQSIHYSDTTLIQAGNIMTLIIPVILFFIFQRVFIRGIVITGIDK